MIAKMERVEFVFVRARLGEIVDFLQRRGVVHIEEVPLAVEDAPGFLHRVHPTDEQQADLDRLDELGRILAEIAPLLAARAGWSEIRQAAERLDALDLDEWRRRARRWSRELRSLTRRKANVEDNIEVMTNHRDTLLLVNRLLGGRAVTLGRDARAFVAHGDVEDVRRRVRRRLADELGNDGQLADERLERSGLLGVVTYPERLNRLVGELLRDEGIDLVDVPDRSLRGIAVPEALAKMEEQLSALRANLKDLLGQIHDFGREIGPELEAMKALVADRMAQLQVLTRFAESDMIAVIQGWIPRAELEPIRAAMAERFSDDACLGRLPMGRVERRRIPVLLQNPSFLRPFEVLMSLLKPPSYGSYDPSIVVGVFFVLFYGFILGDAVYGPVVIGFALLLRRLLRRYEAARQASVVGVYAGISATVFGVLYGEYCGDLGHATFPWLRPLWFPRHNDTMKLLQAAVGFGAVHIVLGLAISIWSHALHGDRKHAMEKLGMLLGLLAVGVAVAAVFGVAPFGFGPQMGVVGLMLAVATALLIKATGAFAAIHLLEVVSLVSNVLSYSRLMALGIASVALADVANRLAEKSGSYWTGIPIFLSIHLLNVLIGMFSPTLHSLRLNYVEFLPKFYAPEGRSYKPFRKEALW